MKWTRRKGEAGLNHFFRLQTGTGRKEGVSFFQDKLFRYRNTLSIIVYTCCTRISNLEPVRGAVANRAFWGWEIKQMNEEMI
jgi:hypothetical protein